MVPGARARSRPRRSSSPPHQSPHRRQAGGGRAHAFTRGLARPERGHSGPVVAGPAVVTADGRTVTGHDARDGRERLELHPRRAAVHRRQPGSPQLDDGVGRVLALYGTTPAGAASSPRCAPTPAARAACPQPRPATRHPAAERQRHADGRHRRLRPRGVALGPRRTLEYGDLPTPVDSRAAAPARLPLRLDPRSPPGGSAVIERCPNEPTDRLTVVAPDGPKGGEHDRRPSSPCAARQERDARRAAPDPAGGRSPGRIRVAVALPDPARLVVLDGAGASVARSRSTSRPPSSAATRPVGPSTCSSDGTQGTGGPGRARSRSTPST